MFDIVTDVVLCDFVAENESPSEAYQDLVFDWNVQIFVVYTNPVVSHFAHFFLDTLTDLNL